MVHNNRIAIQDGGWSRTASKSSLSSFQERFFAARARWRYLDSRKHPIQDCEIMVSMSSLTVAMLMTTHCGTTRMASRGKNRVLSLSLSPSPPLFLSLLFLRRWKAVNRGLNWGREPPLRACTHGAGTRRINTIQLFSFLASPLRCRIAAGDLRRVDPRMKSGSKSEIN